MLFGLLRIVLEVLLVLKNLEIALLFLQHKLSRRLANTLQFFLCLIVEPWLEALLNLKPARGLALLGRKQHSGIDVVVHEILLPHELHKEALQVLVVGHFLERQARAVFHVFAKLQWQARAKLHSAKCFLECQDLRVKLGLLLGSLELSFWRRFKLLRLEKLAPGEPALPEKVDHRVAERDEIVSGTKLGAAERIAASEEERPVARLLARAGEVHKGVRVRE